MALTVSALMLEMRFPTAFSKNERAGEEATLKPDIYLLGEIGATQASGLYGRRV